MQGISIPGRGNSPGDRVAARRAGEIYARLRSHQAEIEHTILARVYSVSDPRKVGDPAYTRGLRAAVAGAVVYALEPSSPGSDEPVPEVLRAQARHAARSGVGLHTVLRRYSAGYAVLGDLLLVVANNREHPGWEPGLQLVWRGLAIRFDRLVEEVAAEYHREIADSRHTTEHLRAEQIKKLLGGELLEVAPDFDYELGAWHLAAIGSGPGARRFLRDLASELGRKSLSIASGDEVWAWLGGGKELPTADVLRMTRRSLPAEVSIALGEPAEGIYGWRLSHHQAKAAMPIARRDGSGLIRYCDVALLASALGDDILAASLRETYIAPLSQLDGGTTLRRTLSAYFATGRNVSSASAMLGVSRHTVRKRLSQAEEAIERTLDLCAADLETALRLEEFEAATSPNREAM